MIRKSWKMLLVLQVVLLLLLLFAGAAQAARPDNLMDWPHNGYQCYYGSYRAYQTVCTYHGTGPGTNYPRYYYYY